MRTGKYVRFEDNSVVLLESRALHDLALKIANKPREEVVSAGCWLEKETAEDTTVVSIYGDSTTLHIGTSKDDKEFIIDALSSQEVFNSSWLNKNDEQEE